MSLFWTASEYAKALGRGRAQALAAHLDRLPAAVVFSRSRLLFAGPGVRERAVAVSASRYRYRYDGLRFVIRSGGAYFLLPDGWTPQRGAAFVLREASGVRFEFLALPKAVRS